MEVSQAAHNITEPALSERQLMQSHKLEAIGDLTRSIVHDFNNLLGIIIGNLDMLEPAVAGDKTRAEQLQDARLAAIRGAYLTRQLLAFARMGEVRSSAASLIDSAENPNNNRRGDDHDNSKDTGN